MIYEKDNVYYLKKGNDYEIANISIKYNRIKKINVLVITGSGIIAQLEEPIEEYTFKELENKLVCKIYDNNKLNELLKKESD